MIVKICGITHLEDAQAAIAGGANALGFNFYPRSKRYIGISDATKMIGPVAARHSQGWGVRQRAAPTRVADLVKRIGLHVAQLHGDEQPEQYPAGVRVWKAARVDDQFSLAAWEACPAEALLLDSAANGEYGGSGQSFDWSARSRWFAPDHPRRRPGREQRARRHPPGEALGGGRLLPHRARAGTKGPRQNGSIHSGRAGGFRMTPSLPDAGGHFGPYGGRFVPEVLMAPIEELEQAYLAARQDPAFQAELSDLLANYAGRPTPLYFASRLTRAPGRRAHLD